MFSINAIHFISLVDFEKRILEFINIVKPGGRGFVTFNLTRMLELTSKEELEQLFSTQLIKIPLIVEYIRSAIRNISIKFLVVDLYIDKEINEIMNGNIRLVFEK